MVRTKKDPISAPRTKSGNSGKSGKGGKSGKSDSALRKTKPVAIVANVVYLKPQTEVADVVDSSDDEAEPDGHPKAPKAPKQDNLLSASAFPAPRRLSPEEAHKRAVRKVSIGYEKTNSGMMGDTQIKRLCRLALKYNGHEGTRMEGKVVKTMHVAIKGYAEKIFAKAGILRSKLSKAKTLKRIHFQVLSDLGGHVIEGPAESIARKGDWMARRDAQQAASAGSD
jgi:histone H3/H4